jgi:hypothetical protein
MNLRRFSFSAFIGGVLLAAPIFNGCEAPPASSELAVTPRVATTNEVAKPRFVVTSQGKFQAGYENSVREIFIITDTKTGEEYLGVTDASIIRRRVEEKAEAAAEAAEALVDIALDFGE